MDLKFTDNIKDDATPFVKKVQNIALDLARTEMNPKVEANAQKGLIIVCAHEVGKPEHQGVIAGMGTPKMLETLAEQILDHPQLGPLFTMKAAEKMMRERFGD